MQSKPVEVEHPLRGNFGAPPWIPPLPLPPCELPEASEIVVVGAGITGLAAALAAAEAGRRVTVVERRFGSGATSRSGGIVLGDTLIGPMAGFEDCHITLRDWIAQSRCRVRSVLEGLSSSSRATNRSRAIPLIGTNTARCVWRSIFPEECSTPPSCKPSSRG